MELVFDFPQINPILTSIRLDASYAKSKFIDARLYSSYNTGWSHTSEPNKSYEFVGLYANGGSGNTTNGKITRSMDMNITSITHIPRARLVDTVRLELTLLKRMQNLSTYNGAEYAFNVSNSGKDPIGGSIYDVESYSAIYPVYYMNTAGDIHPFTQTEANDPRFANLIMKSANAYTYKKDGYDPYFSANISVTKEFGDHVSLSLYANNFTNSRKFVTSYATGVSAIFTPEFYYGLSCSIKF